jgi:hypothetical protein
LPPSSAAKLGRGGEARRPSRERNVDNSRPKGDKQPPDRAGRRERTRSFDRRSKAGIDLAASAITLGRQSLN